MVSIYSGFYVMEGFPFLFGHYMSVLTLFVPLFLKYKVFKNTQLPYRIFTCIFAICPMWTLKSNEWSNLAERIDHKAPIVHTDTVPFSSYLAGAMKLFTMSLKKANNFPKPMFETTYYGIFLCSVVSEICLKMFRDCIWFVLYKIKLSQSVL